MVLSDIDNKWHIQFRSIISIKITIRFLDKKKLATSAEYMRYKLLGCGLLSIYTFFEM